MAELREPQGDSFQHVVSDMGRNADTMFSVDSLQEGLYCAQTSAMKRFKEAMARLRIVPNVAALQGQ